jgi:aryl-alcohol dehydrogenase-like predicted oxidoreductase
MRFRPFGSSGKAVSAVSLALRDGPGMSSPQAWRGLIFTGMENGINCFDLEGGFEPLAQGMGQALQAVERRLIFLIWTIRGEPGRPLTAQTIAAQVRDGLKQTGAKYFDAVMLDESAFSTLTAEAPGYLNQLRDANFVLHLGVRGDGPVLDAAIAQGSFDVLATPYNLTSEWATRRRLREAADRGMVAIAYDFAPAAILSPPKRETKILPVRRNARSPLDGVGTYGFLHETPGWSAEELCLAYAMTEPSLATVQVEFAAADRIEALAAVPERDTPTGLGAQIEMARFCGESPDERRRA